MPTYVVSFAGQSLAIKYPSSVAALIEFLYQDASTDPAAIPDVTLTIDTDGDQLSLQQGTQSLYRGDDESELATTLIQQTIYHLIDKNKDGMALHAAALSINGKGIILPGASGRGKTTLSTWLATRGYNYLTDEYVFIKENTNTIQAFSRPPNVKVKGIDALDSYFDINAHEGQTIRSSQVAMIPPRLLNPNNKKEEAVVSLIVFPNYKKGVEYELEKLSKARAGLTLMECLVNARNLNGHGFSEATRLVRDTPAYLLTYSSVDQLSSQFQEILPK